MPDKEKNAMIPEEDGKPVENARAGTSPHPSNVPKC